MVALGNAPSEPEGKRFTVSPVSLAEYATLTNIFIPHFTSNVKRKCIYEQYFFIISSITSKFFSSFMVSKDVFMASSFSL